MSVVLKQEELAKLPSFEATIAAMRGDAPPTAETVLADARAVYWPRRLTGRDHQRAVLLAAIASEVKVKNRLRELADPTLRPLVQIIFDNPRDVTQSVPQLLHRPFEAIAGRSLLQSNRPLYDGVDKMFRVRNRVAHRGHLPSSDEGRNAVQSATGLFKWLDEVPASDG